MPGDPVSDVRDALVASIPELGAELSQNVALERPRRSEQGDYSSNVAMLLAPSLGKPPREVAARLGEVLEVRLGEDVKRIDVAGPGFLNLFMSDDWHRSAVEAIVQAEAFGAQGQRPPSISLEFVSANPTGPLTAAGGRGAAYGDSLARVLELAGHDVEREYYLNDAGAQVRSFAASISARMAGKSPPDDGYSGDYVTKLAQELSASGLDQDDLASLESAGTEAMKGRIRDTLERFGVHFDTWSSERSLHEDGALDATLAELREGGQTYESDGALWLRTSEFGDDKDRVLIRSGGEPTYFAADVAYHRDKLLRGAEKMIVPLGADHHGYVPRMKAAVEILSGDGECYEAPIMQLVNIVEDGQRARMSKRKGDFVTLDDLIADIGVDAARFFLLGRSHDTVIDLDLELARSESQENPVFYVQYAHARIASIIRKATADRAPGTGIPCAPTEAVLVRRLLEFPDEVSLAADRRAPHRMTAYVMAVAADFHAFYRDCRVVGADEELGVPGLEAARVGVCEAARRVIATGLQLLGVSAPEEM